VAEGSRLVGVRVFSVTHQSPTIYSQAHEKYHVSNPSHKPTPTQPATANPSRHHNLARSRRVHESHTRSSAAWDPLESQDTRPELWLRLRMHSTQYRLRPCTRSKVPHRDANNSTTPPLMKLPLAACRKQTPAWRYMQLSEHTGTDTHTVGIPSAPVSRGGSDLWRPAPHTHSGEVS
jgi:hypothetical protein